jgi:Zn-dependent peptidase ImmA (M78 family)/DNA-binding XRE family transcriptional regulator
MNNSIKPEMITIARESRGYSQSDLAKKMKVSQGKISKMESGLIGVSDEMLKELSKKLNYPENFFMLPEPVYGTGYSLMFHRKRKSLSQKIIATIHAQMNIHRIVVSRLLNSVDIDVKFKPLDIDEYDENVEEIADAVRAAWYIPRGPIKNLTETIERAGGIIIKCDFGTPKVDAISQWIPGLPPLFFVNMNVPGDRLRFSLAHELAHVIMHRVPRPEMEEEADRFAAQFLMPMQEIASSLSNISLAKLASLKLYWKVSMAALLKRASDLKKITDRKARTLWMQMSKAGYRTHEPVELSIPYEEPALLKKIIDVYFSKLNYSKAQLCQYLAIYPDEFSSTYLGQKERLRLVT